MRDEIQFGMMPDVRPGGGNDRVWTASGRGLWALAAAPDGSGTTVRRLAAGALDPQSASAEAIADLYWLMFWLGVAVFVVFAVLLVVACGRRRTAGEDEDEDVGVPARPRPGRSRPGRWFVVWGVTIPAILILVVFGATLVAMRAVYDDDPPADALVVEVVGHQWYYEVRYPEQGISLVDELRLPVGRPTVVKLTSADVIHSFWVPALGGKRDMLPDYTNTLVLEPQVADRHTMYCAEFCGLRHAKMRMDVVVEPADEFAAWVGAQQAAG